MQLETIVGIARRLRSLSDSEFGALESLVCHGVEPADEPTLVAVASALLDCVDLSGEERPHLVRFGSEEHEFENR